MRVFVNNLTPEHPDPEDESYWDFMADSLNMRRYDDEGTRPNSIDLTMTTQVVSFRAPHNGKPPVVEIHCDAAHADILADWLEMMSAVIRQIPKELHSEK